MVCMALHRGNRCRLANVRLLATLRSLPAALVFIQCEEQARPVLAGDTLPMLAREGSFQRPKKIQRNTLASPLGFRVGSHRSERSQLTQRLYARGLKHLGRLGPEIRQL